jgi:peroxiredoxin
MKRFMLLMFLLPIIVFSGELKPLKIGDPAPSFALKNYDGKAYDLATLQKEHKYTVVMFISTECPVSNAYNERMEKLHEVYAKKGIAVIGINANKAEDIKAIAAHSKEHGFKFPVLKDEKNTIADLYGAEVTPETFVINSQGKLMYHGRIDDSRKIDKVQSHDLTDALDALLSGKSVAKTEARAMGCSIKRLGTD